MAARAYSEWRLSRCLQVRRLARGAVCCGRCRQRCSRGFTHVEPAGGAEIVSFGTHLTERSVREIERADVWQHAVAQVRHLLLRRARSVEEEIEVHECRTQCADADTTQRRMRQAA